MLDTTLLHLLEKVPKLRILVFRLDTVVAIAP